MSEPRQALIAGAGIGGLSAALALQRQGWQLQILEQSAQLSEVGAGIQIGPNVTRILHNWGLQEALKACAAEPERLVARHALQGHELGVLPLGKHIRERFGAPYLTIHRADLHGVLLQALNTAQTMGSAQAGSQLRLDLGQTVQSLTMNDGVYDSEYGGVHGSVQSNVNVQTNTQTLQAPLLIGADGLWSRVRASLWQDGPPQATGHVAYRALISMADLPVALRNPHVTVWLGPDLHVVQYPVRAGQAMNVVVIAHNSADAPQGWDHLATTQELLAATAQVCTPLRALLDAMPVWRRWVLFDRAPVSDAQTMARGRVALLGDAAHPMRPYLAQGAGMAIEDAQTLAQCLGSASNVNIPDALQRYADLRWQRNARVQARARRNGRIFHMSPPASWARDLALRLAGSKLMNLPWLYGNKAPGT